MHYSYIIQVKGIRVKIDAKVMKTVLSPMELLGKLQVNNESLTGITLQ